MDQRAAMELARSQLGLITFEQARASGWTRHQILHRLKEGVLEPLHEGVYRFTAVPITWEQQLFAACLAMPSTVAVSHLSGAVLHGLWTEDDPPVEITVGRALSPELGGVVVHRIADLTPRWITTIGGVPVTTPARLLVDVGAVLPMHLAAVVFDRALRRDIASLAEVRSVIRVVARRGRTGVGIARALVAERSVTNGSTELERQMTAIVRRFLLPVPVTEHTVLDEHGQFIARVDFAYPELKYAIEVDGYEPHSGRRAFEHDRVRQNDLVDDGWTIHRFTWRDVNQHPGRIVDRIRRRHAELLGTLKLTGAA
jgi:very-short-patch-repair endonuclease